MTSPEMGRFDPPRHYSFEPELTGPTPRPIPPELYEGRYARKKRNAAWGLLVAGLLCVGLSFVPLVQTWGLYLLPLQYLEWIGLVIALFGVGQFVLNRVSRGPFAYVVDGVPVVARLVDLTARPVVVLNEKPASYQFVATVEYYDPESNDLVEVQTLSENVDAAGNDLPQTTYKVGDYVTAVYLPSLGLPSLRLYGFLDLRSDMGVIHGKGGMGVAGVLGVVALFFGIFGGLGWMIYAMGRYATVAGGFADYWPACAAGSALAGVLLVVGVVVAAARTNRAGQPPVKITLSIVCFTLVMIAGTLLMGAVFGYGTALSLNALLDDSPSTPRLVRIDNFVQTTHKFLFREYQIEYRFVDDPDTKHHLMTTPQHIDQFRAMAGVADVRTGRFGWPWVRDIEPLP